MEGAPPAEAVVEAARARAKNRPRPHLHRPPRRTKPGCWQYSLAIAAALVIAPCAHCLAQNAIQNIVVTSAASFQIGLPARGSVGTMFCTGLSIQGVTGAKTVPLPLSLSDVTVTVGGAVAPLFAVAALNGYQQINFEVPQEATIDNDGSAQIIVQPGASPIVPTGYPAPSQPLAVVPQIDENFSPEYYDVFNIVINGSITVSNDATPGSIPFLGLSPGSVGLYQINFVMPATLGPGDVQIKLENSVCDAMFGSCTLYDSAPVLLPVV